MAGNRSVDQLELTIRQAICRHCSGSGRHARAEAVIHDQLWSRIAMAECHTKRVNAHGRYARRSSEAAVMRHAIEVNQVRTLSVAEHKPQLRIEQDVPGRPTTM